MQETSFVNEQGNQELMQEYFAAPTEEETLAQMESRLLELQGKGHTLVRRVPKIGRNQPCPCGSGRKFKRCCITKVRQ